MFALKAAFTIEDDVLKGEETPYHTDYTSVGKFLLDKIESDEDLIGLLDPVTGEKYTFGQIRERSVRCALWLKSQGIRPGDVIAICTHNQLDATSSCLGAMFVEAPFAPLNVDLNSSEFRHLLDIVKPKIAFASEKSATKIAEAVKDNELKLKIVVLGSAASGFLEFRDIIGQPSIAEVNNFKMTLSQKAHETALIMSSSGTTGLPKGVALSHASLIRVLQTLAKAPELTGFIHMCFSTLLWLSGTYGMLMCLAGRWTNLITPSFDETLACEYVEKYKVNWLMLTPNLINRLLKSDLLGKYDFSSLRVVASSGSALANASREAWAKIFPNLPLISIYGSTELGGGATIPAMRPKPGSSGYIASNTQLKVIDPETGRILGPNQTGELYVKTSTMMNGYYNDPQVTADVIDEQGFMRTGDLGYYDEDGEIFVVDRLKELIKYCNYHISPSEIETLILSHPGVKEAVVVGLPHPVEGEHPIAFVVKSAHRADSGRQVTESNLIDLVAAELTDSKRLRGGVKFVESLPKTPSDKVQRKVVKQMARAML